MKAHEKGSRQNEKVGVREAQELGHASRRDQRPRCNGRPAGKWGTCGWSVVQLDYEELGPLRWMCGSMDAELEFQRTIKRAELTAFLCVLKKGDWTHKSACRQQKNIHGLWRGETKYINPKAVDADLWIPIWEELHLLVSKEISVEVERVKAHRREKDNFCRPLRSLSPMALRKRMSRQRQERCWTKGGGMEKIVKNSSCSQ